MKGDFLAALYPEEISCASCGRDVFESEPFCPSCAKKLTRNDGKFCERCGMPTVGEERYCIRCAENVNYFERAYSVYLYDEGTKPLLRRFKEKGERWLGRVFAGLLSDYMREYRIEADVLTFVPMTSEKRRRRGYNQAEVLARELSRISGIPCEEMLEKVRESAPQKELDFADRQRNLNGCFRLKQGRRTEYRRVLLLDDVMTTTATVNECCRILSKVCENGVKVLTICTAQRKIKTE